MTLGILEIGFCIVSFCAMWFFIFKFYLMYQEKNMMKKMVKGLEEQEGKHFVICGKKVEMNGEAPKEEEFEEQKPVKKAVKNKKEVKKNGKKSSPKVVKAKKKM